jgi:hypothetical protein
MLLSPSSSSSGVPANPNPNVVNPAPVVGVPVSGNVMRYHSGRAEAKAPKYDGRSDVEDWIVSFEVAGKCNRWDPDVYVWAAVNCFEGVVKNWWLDVRGGALVMVAGQSKDIASSWEALKVGLKATFQHPLHRDQVRAQLVNRLMLPTETIPIYAYAIKALTEKVDPLMKDTDRLYHFLKGLPTNIQAYVKMKKMEATHGGLREDLFKLEDGINAAGVCAAMHTRIALEPLVDPAFAQAQYSDYGWHVQPDQLRKPVNMVVNPATTKVEDSRVDKLEGMMKEIQVVLKQLIDNRAKSGWNNNNQRQRDPHGYRARDQQLTEEHEEMKQQQQRRYPQQYQQQQYPPQARDQTRQATRTTHGDIICGNCQTVGHSAYACPAREERKVNRLPSQQPAPVTATTAVPATIVRPAVNLVNGVITPSSFALSVEGSIQGVDTMIVIDTGAPHSFISERFLRSGGDSMQIITKPQCEHHFQTANSSDLHVLGEVEVGVEFGSHFVSTTPLLVVPNLASDVLIGMDLLPAMRAIIDMGQKPFQLRFDSRNGRETVELRSWATRMVSMILSAGDPVTPVSPVRVNVEVMGGSDSRDSECEVCMVVLTVLILTVWVACELK